MLRTSSVVALALLLATIAGCSSPAKLGARLRVLHSFDQSDGAWPRGSLTADGDVLFGRTSIGGDENNGTIFRIRTDGSGFESLYSFTAGADNHLGNQPHHNSMLLVDGRLIGAALYGGNTRGGDASDGSAAPDATKAGNGTVFRIERDGTDYAVLQEFDGGTESSTNPHSGPMISPAGDVLYGLTSDGGAYRRGTLYRIAVGGGDYRLLHSFDEPTGYEPHGVVAFVDGGKALLGITRKGGKTAGGAEAGGVVFRFDLDTGAYSVLHFFEKNSRDDGSTNAHGFLTLVDGFWYATEELGGKHDKGVVFRMRTDGSDDSIVHSFGGSGDGATPFGSLVLVGEWLYGTTIGGGANGDGTVFRLRPSDLKYEVLASFDRGTTGAFPEDNVIPASSGSTLYGLTQAGGVNDPTASNYFGTVFALDLE